MLISLSTKTKAQRHEFGDTVNAKAFSSDVLFQISAMSRTTRTNAALAIVSRADDLGLHGRDVPVTWLRTVEAFLPNIKWCAVSYS